MKPHRTGAQLCLGGRPAVISGVHYPHSHPHRDPLELLDPGITPEASNSTSLSILPSSSESTNDHQLDKRELYIASFPIEMPIVM